MLTLIHSNNLDVQKDILLEIMRRNPQEDIFTAETILVQTANMAQWLQLKMAKAIGISANMDITFPISFFRRQYQKNLPNMENTHAFSKEALTWQLMNIIPQHLGQDTFSSLRHYLDTSIQDNQQKLYQLAFKLADLFDQYLVHRPDWIEAWENNDETKIKQQISSQLKNKYHQNNNLETQIYQDILWQGQLWRALVEKIHKENPQALHPVAQNNAFLAQLKQPNLTPHLPKRIFVFGISALPALYLQTLKAISQYTEVYLFFHNPSQEYWADIVDPKYLAKRGLQTRTDYYNHQIMPYFSEEQLKTTEFEKTHNNELLQVGNPLLSQWGKHGRDYFYLLTNDLADQEITAFVNEPESHLLSQIQNRIFTLTPNQEKALILSKNDESLTIHSCHSKMREVQVLQDYLLKRLKTTPHLTPKDIVVMVPDIDLYAPYIQAVFGQYSSQDPRFIPYSISDNKLKNTDVTIAAFLTLLNLKESRFTTEEILALLDIPAISAKFEIDTQDLPQLHQWIKDVGIRFGLSKTSDNQQTNYNAWKAGLERLLLGFAMKEEQGIWQDSLGFDESYGLQSQLTGKLACFIDQLDAWHNLIKQPYTIEQWQIQLEQLLIDFFEENEETFHSLQYLRNILSQLVEQIVSTYFSDTLDISVISQALTELLNGADTSQSFLAGKVSFATLIPMRSIPFKVVCLLGMNESDFPRLQTYNSFDLLQYHHQKGDRFRRDSDRYLFLEALLAAEDFFYLSFIGQSAMDNSQKEPSVIVNQLLDYLAENIQYEELTTPEEIRTSLVKPQSMTVFSSNNFKKSSPSFAKEWLPLAQNIQYPIENFDTSLTDHIELPKEIELTQLIKFISEPVKYFFEQQLGVYFSKEDDPIPEMENFTLNKLDEYLIRDELLSQPDKKIEDYFQQLAVKGTLPQGQFGQIYQQQQKEQITALKLELADYLQQTPKDYYIELELDTNFGKVTLFGNIDSLYDENLQRITWHAGTIKEKLIIKNWIIYLAQLVDNSQTTSPRFIDKSLKWHGFTPISQEEAKTQLKIYLNAFLEGFSKMQIVPSEVVLSYFKVMETDNWQSPIDKLINGDINANTPSNLYWSRLAKQQNEWNKIQIDQKIENWFRLMETQYS